MLWVQGSVEDQSIFSDQKRYAKIESVQDYHDMLSHILQEMHDICKSGGIGLTLDFGVNIIHKTIGIHVIQFIIGDCIGNDVLCGRLGGYLFKYEWVVL